MTSHRRTPFILVVDDDVVTSQMIHGLLSRAGYEVASAGDASAALEGIRARRPDLVLLDVNLPDASGLEVCQKLHADPAGMQTPVLFISADREVSSKVRGFEAGGVDYIPKPFAGEEVLARVSTHLRLRQAFESLAELQAERIQRLALAQETLMPAPSELPQARFQVCLKQALKAGGDFYDVIPVGQDVVDYVVADASGHDLGTSFWTAALKTLLNEYATPAETPANVLRSINSALIRILPAGVFFTVLYARLNRQTNRLLLVNAGHPPAVLIRSSHERPIILEQQGDVLGAFSDARFGVREVAVVPNDRVFLFSDGLIELSGDWAMGLDRLAGVCRSSRHEPLDQAVQSIVADLTCVQSPGDDLLVLGVEI